MSLCLACYDLVVTHKLLLVKETRPSEKHLQLSHMPRPDSNLGGGERKQAVSGNALDHTVYDLMKTFELPLAVHCVYHMNHVTKININKSLTSFGMGTHITVLSAHGL